jgi:hypothetical protein
MISPASSWTHAYAGPQIERAGFAVREGRHLERARDAAREARHLEREAALSALAAQEAAAAMTARGVGRVDLFL